MKNPKLFSLFFVAAASMTALVPALASGNSLVGEEEKKDEIQKLLFEDEEFIRSLTSAGFIRFTSTGGNGGGSSSSVSASNLRAEAVPASVYAVPEKQSGLVQAVSVPTSESNAVATSVPASINLSNPVQSGTEPVSTETSFVLPSVTRATSIAPVANSAPVTMSLQNGVPATTSSTTSPSPATRAADAGTSFSFSRDVSNKISGYSVDSTNQKVTWAATSNLYKWVGSDSAFDTATNWKKGSIQDSSVTITETTATPARADNYGYILYFDGSNQTVNITGGTAARQNTSDGGGIWVTGTGNTITASLGQWGGSVQVDAGNTLNTNWTDQLKDGTLIANGTINITQGNLNLDDGGGSGTLERLWYVGENGSINFTHTNNVTVSTTNGKIKLVAKVTDKTATAGEQTGIVSKKLVTTAGTFNANGKVSIEAVEKGGQALSNTTSISDLLSSDNKYYSCIAGSGVSVLYKGKIDKIWAGTSDNKTWDTSATNWSNSASFSNGDDVAFTSTAAEKSLTINSTINAGSINVLSGEYTFSGNGSVNGSVLYLADSATLKLVSNTRKLGATTPIIIDAGGKLYLNNGASSNASYDVWDSVTFLGQTSKDATLELFDIAGSGSNTGLQIKSLIVNSDKTGKILSTWDGTVEITKLSGAGKLMITGSSQNEKMTYKLNNYSEFSGTLDLQKAASGANLDLNLTGNSNGNSKANFILGNGVTLVADHASASFGYSTLTLKAGSTLQLRTGNDSATRIIGGSNSKIIVDAQGGVANIKGTIYGNVADIQGTILGAGTLNFSYASNETNNYKVSAAIKDGTAPDVAGKLALSVNLAAGQKLTLSGQNTYTGGTVIHTGTLNAGNNSALGTGTVEIKSGARLEIAAGVTLQSGNYRVVVGDALKNNSAIFGTGTGKLSDSATISLVAGTALDASQGVSYKIYEGSNVDALRNKVSFSSELSGWYAYTKDNILYVTIPEPSLFGLLAGMGALALIGSRRRRK